MKQDIPQALRELKMLNEQLGRTLDSGMGEASHLEAVGHIVGKMARIVGIDAPSRLKITERK